MGNSPTGSRLPFDRRGRAWCLSVDYGGNRSEFPLAGRAWHHPASDPRAHCYLARAVGNRDAMKPAARTAVGLGNSKPNLGGVFDHCADPGGAGYVEQSTGIGH